MECYTFLRNVQDLLSDGKTPYERRFGQPFKGRREFGRVTCWLQTLRSWNRWMHLKCTRKDSMRKRWYFRKKWKHFQSQMDDSNFLEEIRTWEHPLWVRDCPIRGESHVDFLGKSEGSLPPLYDSFPDAGEAIHDFWSKSGNFTNRHHVEPRVNLLLAEKRIIPYSTKIHWCIKNYLYKFGCQTRETHRWLLEYRWVTRLVRSLDRFHTIYSIRWETSRWICVVLGETDEKNSWHPCQIIYGQNSGRICERMPSWRRSKSGRIKSQNSIMHENWEEFISLTLRTRKAKKPSRMLARNWKHQWLPLCFARQARTVSMWWQVVHPTRSNQNLRVFWKPVNPQDCVWENLYRIIMKTILQEKETIHCSMTIWFTNLFLCPKPWRYLQQKQQCLMGETWKDSSVGRDRWSKDEGRKSSFCLTDGHMSSKECWIGDKPKIQRSSCTSRQHCERWFWILCSSPSKDHQ